MSSTNTGTLSTQLGSSEGVNIPTNIKCEPNESDDEMIFKTEFIDETVDIIKQEFDSKLFINQLKAQEYNGMCPKLLLSKIIDHWNSIRFLENFRKRYPILVHSDIFIPYFYIHFY